MTRLGRGFIFKDAVLFGREAGRVVASRGRLELKGSLTLSAQGQDQRCGFELAMRTEVLLQPAGR